MHDIIINIINLMLFLIRHGERADDSTNNEKAAIILNFDPHLSA